MASKMNIRALKRQSTVALRHARYTSSIRLAPLCLAQRATTTTSLVVRHYSDQVRSLRSKGAPKYPEPSVSEAQESRTRTRPRFDIGSIRKAVKENPVQGGIAIVLISFLGAAFVCVVGFELWAHFFVKHNYPDNVAKSIRKALYFTNVKPDPARALRFYKEALFGAQEAGLHPISDEVLGLKLQLGFFFEEKAYSIDNAIIVYEGVYKDCVDWLAAEGDKHLGDGHHTRVLERAVRTAVKLGELYGMPQIKRFNDSEEILAIATETVLKERYRRTQKGAVVAQRDFLSDDEVGAAMEKLAEAYSSRSKPHLAAPLYLHAISLCPKDSCHSVVLMNNLASAVAEQPSPATSISLPRDFPNPSQQAESWARQALALASSIPASKRDEECVLGCATARANIAELIERDGRLQEALAFFVDAEHDSRSIGYEEGIKVSSEGRARVTQAIQAQST